MPSSGSTITFTYTPLTTTTGAYYYFAVVSAPSNSGCGFAAGGTLTSGTSGVAGTQLVTVNAPPVITGQPSTSPQTLCANTPSTPLSVTATGTALTYQWYSNTVNLNSGGTLIILITSLLLKCTCIDYF